MGMLQPKAGCWVGGPMMFGGKNSKFAGYEFSWGGYPPNWSYEAQQVPEHLRFSQEFQSGRKEKGDKL